ncbi:hypothetical protein CROQUDRAFT_86706 [Cronartium quercuum f. sp. fusiforme G11]|uniref:Uncharacterized protein n=1 Tax=Cronartium quercuum f. sp. fusiforme G11 TaxID=708437 RepID=A0A9P6NY53_9BASI|nr:hypothetical protein CROQUDRAFT_86706 [Cronartium quercuum f. sp. fusiforme G11]
MVTGEEIKPYGWLGAGDGCSYLEAHPELKSYQTGLGHNPQYSPAQNMARWALSQLMGYAEGNLNAWKSMAAEWKNAPLPDDESPRKLEFTARLNDEVAMIAYLGSYLSGKSKKPPANIYLSG